ncbi:MAG: hypothetical protein JO085_07460 [Acidimicrobiia bacterium]|nr:hypothetical protein [Acidimicrobiia bacterium]
MPILDESHDFAHPVEGDSAWSESYYFNCYDPEADTGFFTRIGIRPNEGTMDVGLSAWLPGSELAVVRGVREQTEMVDTGLEVAGVTYERLSPLKEWRIACAADAVVLDLGKQGGMRPGRLAMDVTFSALIPALGTDGQGRRSEGAAAETSSSVGRGHLEQAGRWSGWIEADGQRYVLGSEARGNRDKSWGPRRWGGPKMWRWFSINVGDDMHFGGIRIGTDAGDLHRGWVWRDGEASSIRDWDVRTEVAEDGLTHRVSHVRATDKRGRVHDLRADVLRVAGLPQRHGERRTIVNEGLARWTYEGRTGYGIAEYLHQLDEDGKPLTAIE